MKKRVLSLFLAITLCLTLTPTGALAAEGQPPEQTVSVTQEAQIPAPALEEKEEEKTTPAQTGADENASPASPEENPTEDAPAAAEKNTADGEPGKETDKETGKETDEETGKETGKQAVQNEPTVEGENEPLALALDDAGQDAADGENGEAGGTSISEEDTRTEIWCVSKPDSIGRSYDGTTDGGTIPIDLTFTDGTNEIKLKEGTDFTAKKTFDSADAGWHTVTVEIALTGETAVKYKLKAGEETFTIGGNINKAYPKLTVTLSKTACTAGEKLLPLLSVEGAPEDAKVTYYYLASEYKSWAGSSDVEGSEAMPKIDENTAISEPGTYYVYAKTAETTNYEEERSATVELTVTEPAAASVSKADGTVSGTYKTLPAALDAAQDGDTVKLLADHTTNWSDVDAGEYATLAVVKKTLTLDLNGMTVDYLTVGEVVPDEEGGILHSTDGNLTVVENAQGGSCGKIKDLEFVKGSLAIQGGRIGGSLTCDGNSGTVTISGGTVCYVTVGDGATVTVTGGTGHAGTWCNDGTLNITDGTFGNVEFLNNGGTIAISGGTFGTITNINGSSSIPLMPLLADNYAFYQGDNAQNSTEKTLTNVTVRPHTHSFENGKCDCGVAAIVVDNNNSCYNTLQAALAAAADNASITSVTLGQDLTEDITFSGSEAGSLTLNMNGHKLETEAGVPLIVAGGTLRIEGAGEINQNTASNATAFPAISLTGGKLVITGDLAAQGGYDSSSGRKPAIYATGGELDLQGNVSLNGGLTILDKARLTNLLTKGTFYVDASETGNAIAITDSEVPGAEVYKKALDLLAKDHAFYRADDSLADAGGFKLRTGTYTIKSHTCSYTQDETHGIAYCSCGRSHAHRDLSEEKSVLVNGVCPICGYHCPHNTVDETTLSCSDCGAKVVAKVEVEGSEPTYAFDLASAFQNAVNGTTVKLLANEMLPDGIYVSKTLTLDLDGHSLSGYSLNVGGLTPTGQVRTGKLTVIDSSGGNGAVGVTVRDGGTLVFDPENDSTTLLQLEVWGGTVELHGGKISRQGLRLNNSITLGNLLPQNAGLAYYCGDTQLTLAEAASKTCDLVVKTCAHGGKNGFDENATACPYCNAPAVAETALNNGPQRRFADLQTALDADRDGGATLQMLTDVTGDYTIDGTKNTGLNLNGHSIKGTVTVKGIKDDFITTTLSNTVNTTTVSIDKVVAFDGAELAGSKFPAVIGTLTLAEGATWKNILNLKTLGYKVLNGDGTYKWYTPNDVKDSQLNNVIINSLPITSKTLNLKVDGKNLPVNSPKVERGTTVQLCADCNTKDATVEFSILKKGETTPITLTKPSYAGGKYTKDYSFDTIGEYTIYFTATKDGYSVTSNHKKLTVTKATIPASAITAPTAQENLTYTGQKQALIIAGMTDHGTMQYSLTENGTYSQDIPTGTDAGAYTVWYRVIGDANHNDTAPASVAVRIGQKPLTITGVTAVSKPYDGTTNADISSVTFDGVNLNRGTDYTVTANFDDASVGNNKMVTAAVTLMGQTAKNYALEQSSFPTTGSITKAAIDPSDIQLYQTVFNDLAKTYEIDLNQVLDKILPEGGEYGDIVYGQPSVFMDSAYYPVGGANIENGKLSLSINKAASSNQGDEIGTVTVQVETTNYQPFTLTIHVSLQDKLVPVLAKGSTVSASEITYGQTLADSKLMVNGTMQDSNTHDAVNGTFAWTDGTIKPDASDSYEAEWTFTPAAGYEKYATVTGTVTIKVKPAELTVSVKASSMYYTGEEQIASIIASGESVDSTPVTFTYSDKKDGNYTSGGPTFTDAGTYTVYYKAEAANHEPATGTFTVTIDPLPIRLLSVSSISKTYDGSADVTLTADKLTFFSKTANIKLPDTALSFSDAQFTSKQADGSYLPSPEVGNGKALSFTMTLTSNNYVFEGKSEGTTKVSDVFATDDANRFTITKAAAPTMQPIELTVINGLAKTYLVNLPALPTLGDNCKYGSIEYEACNFDLIGEGGYANSTATITSNDEFQLTVPAVESQTEGSVGTVGVKITTDNYQDMLLTVEVIAKNKIVPVLDGEITATPITFGQILRVSNITGTMKDDGKTVEGTFEWTDPSTKPDKAGDYQAEWRFTPAEGYEKYATVTGTVTIKVNKAAIPTNAITAPTAQENLTYTGQKQALIIAGMTDYGTMQYSLTENGTYSQDIPTGTDAGEYTVWYRVFGDKNHNDTKPASVAVSIGKKPLTITGVTAASKPYSKPYDGTTNADITSVTFDNVTLIRGTDYTVTASFDDAGVGKGKNVTATVTLMGQTAKNYFLEQSSFPTTGSITAKQVTVTGITAKDKVYDGTTNATLDCSNAQFDGILENDTLTVTATGAWESAGVGKQKVTISELTLDGASAANYVLAESGNQTETTATITAKEVTVTPDNKSKVYEEKDPDLTYKVDGVLDGETLIDITLTRAEGENAGEYAITATAVAGANPNYDVTFAEGTLTIEPKSIMGAKVVLGKGLAANGAEQTQTVEKVLLDGKELPADSYTVAGNTATAHGIYTLTVTGKGNYKDSVKWTYVIAPAKAEDAPGEDIAIGSETKKNEVAAPTPAPTPASTSKPSTITAMPQTGDTSNPTLYVVLLVVSLLGLAVVFVCKKRNDK